MSGLLSRREMMRGVLGVAAVSSVGGIEMFAQMARNGRPTGMEMGEMNRINPGVLSAVPGAGELNRNLQKRTVCL